MKSKAPRLPGALATGVSQLSDSKTGALTIFLP
jgi:hypothetical protein